MKGTDAVNDMAQIEQAEARLRDAMLAGDVGALDALLSADTVFTNQTGARLTKADDIAVHRSGLLRIERLDPEGHTLIRVLGDSAIVCMTVELAGTYEDQPFGGTFAYTRIWHRSPSNGWQVEAAHCSPVGNG